MEHTSITIYDNSDRPLAYRIPQSPTGPRFGYLGRRKRGGGGLTVTKKSHFERSTSTSCWPIEWAPSTRLRTPYFLHTATMRSQGITTLFVSFDPTSSISPPAAHVRYQTPPRSVFRVGSFREGCRAWQAHESSNDHPQPRRTDQGRGEDVNDG